MVDSKNLDELFRAWIEDNKANLLVKNNERLKSLGVDPGTISRVNEILNFYINSIITGVISTI